ncbi:MAG: NYN domain-containing protein [Kiritimatiellae bacterium]|nr:NYN domain-containing protein [Kiritimatiellia bacterium]
MALKAMVFIDGNWFYHSRQALFNLKNQDGFELDYRRIPSLLSEWLTASFDKEVEVVKCIYFGVVQINKQNCNSTKQVAFYNFLKSECSFEVVTSTIDYKSDVSISEDRAIALSLAASVLKNNASPDTYDVATFVCGSSDYIPLIKQIRALGKKTAVVTMRNFEEAQHSSNQLHTKNIFTDAAPIFFDDHVDELRLIRHEQMRECKSCGAKELTTWAGPEFYCSNCRSGYQRKR